METINIILHCTICKYKWTITITVNHHEEINLRNLDICPECGAQSELQEEDRAPK